MVASRAHPLAADFSRGRAESSPVFRRSEHSEETPVAGDVLGSLVETANLFAGVAGGQVLDSLCSVVFTARLRSWLGRDAAQFGDMDPWAKVGGS